MTLTGTQSFASLDGSASDHDGSANGVFTVNDGDLTVNGVVNCNDDGVGDSACSMAFAVSGNMTIGTGGALYAENRSGGGTGGAITLTVGGNLALNGNAIVSTASKSSSGATAGAITANVTGTISTAAGTTIDAGSANAKGGAILLSAGNTVSVDGNVLSGPSRTFLATRLSVGAALDGGSSNSAGGAITIKSITFVEPAITIGSNASVVSQGSDGGADPVTLEGCGIIVKGLVAGLSRKDSAASVRIRSGKDVLVDGRDLGTGSGTRLGRVRADASSGTAANKGIDVYAAETIDLLGPTDPSSFLLSAVPGTYNSKSYGGTVRVISTGAVVNASGNVVDAGHTASGDTGGMVDISAKGNVNLNTAVIDVVGDFNTSNTNRGGGSIRVRSYSGNVVWTNGVGEVRPVGSTSNLAPADQGSIVLTACGTINTAGTSFPVMGVATSPLPETHTGVCSPAAPSLPVGTPVLPTCNTPPVANDATASTLEDNSVTITLSGTDADGDPLTFSIVSGPANGSLGAINPTGPTSATVTYTPNLNYNGTDSFVYRADDGNGGTDDATVVITITPVNDPPTFLAGPTKVVLEDSGAQTFANWATGITPGPADESAQTVTFTVTNSNPSLFSVQPAVSSNGTLTFTPAANANGAASLQIVAKDNGGTANGGNDTSAPQTSSITVTAVNDAPSFIKGADQTANEDSGAQTVNPWATGISAGPNEGTQTVTFVVTTADPSLFSVQPAVSSSGVLTYSPAANKNGSTSISIYAKDDGGTANGGVDTSSAQTFNISITAVNDAPSFVKGPDQTVDEDSGAQTVNPWATSISVGPTDESTQTVHFLVTGNTNAGLFSVAPAIAPDGTLTYTPAPNASGTATITVKLMDDGGTANGGVDTSAAQTFDINVTAINDAPSFTAGGAVTVLEDSAAYSATWATGISAGPNEGSQTVSFMVTNNSDPSLFSVQPAISASGVLTFTLASNKNGSASITVVLKDDGGTANGGVDTSSAETFSINITAVNDAPSFTGNGNVTLLEDSGAYSGTWATGISAGPADENGQSVSFIVTYTNATLFSVPPSINASGVLTFTLNADAFGSSSVTVKAKDDGGTANGGADTSGAQVFTLNVTGVNDAPSFTGGGNVNVNEDSGPYAAAWATGISAGPVNESGQTVSFVVTNSDNTLFSAQPALSSTGVLTFTPAPNKFGTGTVTVYAQDNGGTANGGVDVSGTQTFTIVITHVNEAPTAMNDAYDTVGNTLLQVAASHTASPAVYVSGSLLSNDTDTDGPSPLSASLVSATSGAVVTVNPDGTFTYVPPPGASGTDSFVYQITDGTSTANATVTITIKGRVWYVKNNDGGTANGTSANPFTTLTAAQTASSAGDTVFVFTGDGTTAGQNSGYVFKNNQRLIGEGVALTVPVSVNGGANPTTLHAAGTRPNISNSAAVGVLATNNGTIEVAGLNIAASTDGISVTVGVTQLGTTSLHDLGVVSAGSRGIVITGAGNNTATVSNTTVNSTGNALEVRGPHIVSVDGNSFSATGGNGVDFDASSGSPRLVSFLNNSVSGNTSGTGVFLFNTIVDAVPGGTLNVVNGGTLTIGSAGNPVGGAGLALTNTYGHLSFTTVSIDATSAGITAGGAGNFTGAAGTQITALAGSVNATGGAAVSASSATLALTLSNATSANSSASGIFLNDVDGSLSATGGSLTNASGSDVNIANSSMTFSYGGTITDDLGQLVNVTSSQGTYNFTGAITDGNDGDGNGISLTSNAGASISFTGGVVLSTGANAAFTATGGGTLAVTGANNTITTTNGTALNVANTAIGASGLTFRSINVDGNDAAPVNGIVLNNTGTAAGLTVTGFGGAGSGGTIRDTSGDGISLSATEAVSLSWMNITSNLGTGIRGMTVNGFVLSNGAITDNGDSAPTDDSGIDLVNLTGTAIGGARPTAIQSSVISNNYEFEVQITNSSGVLTDFQISNSTVSSNGASGAHGNLVNFLALGTANMTLNVSAGSYTGAAPATATGIHVDASGGTVVANIANASINNNNVGVNVSTALDGTLTFDVHDNTINGTRTHALNYFIASNHTGTSSGKFHNNSIGTLGVVGSGSQLGFGVRVQNEALSNAAVLVTNNQMREFSTAAAINVNHGIVGSPLALATNVTITGNTIRNVNASRAIIVQQNVGKGTVCADIAGNDMAGVAGQAGDGSKIRIRQLAGGTFNVKQKAASAAADAQELDDANSVGANVTTAAQVSAAGTFNYNAGGCPQP